MVVCLGVCFVDLFTVLVSWVSLVGCYFCLIVFRWVLVEILLMLPVCLCLFYLISCLILFALMLLLVLIVCDV